MGFIDDGIADISLYIKRHPQSSVAYTKRGLQYLRSGNGEKAQKDFLMALKIDSNNAEAHDDLGVLYAQKREYAKAMEHFNRAISLDPTYQKAYHNLAMLLHIAGDNANAINRINQSLKLNPHSRNSLLLKSSILDSLGRIKEASQVESQADLIPEGEWYEQAPVK